MDTYGWVGWEYEEYMAVIAGNLQSLAPLKPVVHGLFIFGDFLGERGPLTLADTLDWLKEITNVEFGFTFDPISTFGDDRAALLRPPVELTMNNVPWDGLLVTYDGEVLRGYPGVPIPMSVGSIYGS